MEKARDKAVQRWTLVLASAGSLMVALDALIVATALTDIGRQFNAPIESLEWTVNAYTLSFAVLLMTAAAIGDRIGWRETFAAGLALFTAASAACALSQSIGWLIAARAAQGVGAAMIMPMALAQVSAAFPPSRRGWALGVYSSITALSTIVGPLLGGLLTEGIAWQSIFWVNVPIGLIVVAFALTRLPRISGKGTSLDIPGLFLVTGAAFGLVWGLVRANAAGWGSVETMVSIGGGLALLGLFVAWERRAHAPMIPLRLFRLRVFTAGNAATFLLFGALMGAIFFLAQFQQIALGQGPLVAGLRLLPWGLAVVIMAPFAGRIAARIGDANTVAIGLIVHAAGLAWLGMIASPSIAYDDDRADGIGWRRLRSVRADSPESSGERRAAERHRQGFGDAQHEPAIGRRVWACDRGLRVLVWRGEGHAAGIRRRIRCRNGGRGAPVTRCSHRRALAVHGSPGRGGNPDRGGREERDRTEHGTDETGNG